MSGSANAAVTLYEVSRAPTRTRMAAGVHITTFQAGTTTVYAIGTGPDGKTTYVQDNILSLLVLQYPLPDNPALLTTTTIISEAETVAGAFVNKFLLTGFSVVNLFFFCF